MKRESNAPEITRRGFLTLGAVGAVALVTPHGAFALDGVPAGGVSGDLSNIVVEPIENGWRVRDTSTGEVGTVVFLGNGRDSVATMPGGEIIVTRWNNDGTVTETYPDDYATQGGLTLTENQKNNFFDIDQKDKGWIANPNQ